jgi:AraC-like DNA-binding protein
MLTQHRKATGVSTPIVDTVVEFPAPELRPFITHYAGFRMSGQTPSVHFGLPSSNVDLIISLDGSIDLLQMNNSLLRPSPFKALVCGLHDAPAIVRKGTDTFGLHVFIKPLGVRAILGVASAEISSLVVHLSDIWGKRAEDLLGMLRAAGTWRQRFAILDRAFASKLHPTGRQMEISWAWNRLAKTHGAVPIQQLAEEIGYSRRYFSECFREAIGVAPKSASRVFRFERACRILASRHLGLAEVAIACGYYDQAHLTREWYALAGCSPKAWIARDLPFLQDYEIWGRDNEPHGHESLHPPLVRRPV